MTTEQPGAHPAEAELAQLQDEFARMRSWAESAIEREHDERRRADRAERMLDELAREAVALQERTRADGARRSRGVFARRRSAADDVALVESSNLFDPIWYVARHPEVLASGMSPAEFYLAVGALRDDAPGPKFDPSRYRRRRPRLAPSEIPLLHRLRSLS